MGGSSLTMARLRGNKDMRAAGAVREEIEQEMISSSYLDNAPFDFIGLTIRYGLKYDEKPHFLGLDQKTLCCEYAIEVDVNDMLETDYDGLVAIFRKAALIALVYAGKKYDLKTDRLEEMLNDIGSKAWRGFILR